MAFGGLVGGGLPLWTGQAFASHNLRTLHTCVSQAGTIRVAESCQALENAVVLVREEALTDIPARLAAVEAAQVDALANRVSALESRVGAVEAENAALKGRVGAVESTLAGVTRSGEHAHLLGDERPGSERARKHGDHERLGQPGHRLQRGITGW